MPGVGNPRFQYASGGDSRHAPLGHPETMKERIVLETWHGLAMPRSNVLVFVFSKQGHGNAEA
jgi:hypothetical protein